MHQTSLGTKGAGRSPLCWPGGLRPLQVWTSSESGLDLSQLEEQPLAGVPTKRRGDFRGPWLTGLATGTRGCLAACSWGSTCVSHTTERAVYLDFPGQMFLSKVHLFLSRAGEQWLPGTGTGTGSGERGEARARVRQGRCSMGWTRVPRARAPAPWVTIAASTGHLHLCRSRFLFGHGKFQETGLHFIVRLVGRPALPSLGFPMGFTCAAQRVSASGVLPRTSGPDAQCVVRTHLQSTAPRPQGRGFGMGTRVRFVLLACVDLAL